MCEAASAPRQSRHVKTLAQPVRTVSGWFAVAAVGERTTVLSDHISRAAGLILVVMFFGLGAVYGFANLGDPAKTVPVGTTLFGLVLGLFAIFNVWSASRFRYAEPVAVIMLALFLVGYPLRLVVHIVALDGQLRGLAVVLGAVVLAFGKGKADKDVPRSRWQKRHEAKPLPKLNRWRAKRGLPPVSSLDEQRQEQRDRR